MYMRLTVGPTFDMWTSKDRLIRIIITMRRSSNYPLGNYTDPYVVNQRPLALYGYEEE